MKPGFALPRPPTAAEAWLWLRGVATLNVGYKLLSLALATAIWGWVQSRRIVDVTLWVEVSYVTAPELVLAAPVPGRIRMTVRGPQAFVKELRHEELETSMDLTEQAEGLSSVEFEAQKIPGVPDEVDVVNLKPNQVQVELARKVMQRLTLKPSYSGQLPRGYRITGIALDPPFIDVEGPASALKVLNEIIIDSIAVDDLRKSAPKVPVSVRLPPNVVRVDSAPIYAAISVEPLFSERRLDDVDVFVRAEGWLVEPQRLKEVMVVGPPPLLANMTADDLHVRVMVDADAPREPTRARWDDREGSYLVVQVLNEPGRGGVTVKSIDPEWVTIRPEPEDEDEDEEGEAP